MILSILFALPLAVTSPLGGRFDSRSAADPRGQSEPAATGVPADAPLAPYQEELLELAFEAASAMPLVPHVKNRSRAQEAVVTACLELDQPQRALRCIEGIANWRRGAGYADYAFYCARRGATGEVQRYLDLADHVAENPGEENPQEWRRDRIKVKIARTHALLGRTEQAVRLEAGVAESESGKVAAVEAMVHPPERFDAQVQELDRFLANATFDQLRNALVAYVQLFDRYYEDGERRALVKRKIASSWKHLPVHIRIQVTMELADSSLDHGDEAGALELLNDAHAVLESSKWTAEHKIPLMAGLAERRHRAGDTKKARAQAEAALALFEAERPTIIDIYRAETLHPLAEAYHATGDTATALAIYRRAVEEAVHNPNSRPRAEDLSATCISMAAHGVEPDAELLARMREINEALDDPW